MICPTLAGDSPKNRGLSFRTAFAKSDTQEEALIGCDLFSLLNYTEPISSEKCTSAGLILQGGSVACPGSSL